MVDAVGDRAAALRAADPDAPATIPPDALTASGSGLDRYVSPEYAAYQVPGWPPRARCASRRFSSCSPNSRHAAPGFVGQVRVNVSELDVALETADPAAGRQ